MKDVLMVKQQGGKWTQGRTLSGAEPHRAANADVPSHVRLHNAVITSRILRIDTDGLNLRFSKAKLLLDSATADPGSASRSSERSTTKVVERRP
jgi:hypothetical protein